MRFSRRCLLVLWVIAAFASCAVATAAEPLRAAFWNIQWFPGARPNPSEAEETRQIDAVHRDITRLNADVIGFSEMRDWNAVELALKPLPGFKVDVCSTYPPREGQNNAQQIAIASRLQPMSAWVEQWNTDGPIVPPRGFAFAAFQLDPQRLLLVYALHLKSNHGEPVENFAIRQESIRQLLAHMKDMEAAYGKLGAITWLIMGDFNTDHSDPRFEKDKTL
ncbi:MAG: endonuclease/exonuclease/phosphatase family protein, partial [Chthoniobacterales bacterium]|nr:endonuclease/exonuclease/phosphatase family protein [Chthoniobacterales bacterium]